MAQGVLHGGLLRHVSPSRSAAALCARQPRFLVVRRRSRGGARGGGGALMGAYVLRRLALIVPTLIGIMLINFILIQFVPGGPIEQILANLEGTGDVTEGFAGGGDAGSAGAGDQTGGSDGYLGSRGLPPEFIAELE